MAWIDLPIAPHPCGYLPDQTASMAYRVGRDVTGDAYDRLLERGWRRHGYLFFRPACAACRCCRSLRVIVTQFRPTRSQRRCLQRNRSIEVEISRPAVSAQHFELYERYHWAMHRLRGWPEPEGTIDDYGRGFVAGHYEFAYEFRYWRGPRLVGVGLVDWTVRSGSSVYFYHDPDWRAEGPGIFSLLAELQFMAQQGVEHHYLGYWIPECPSMAYKSQYGPHELLQQYVDDETAPVWLPVRPQE